MVTKVSPSAAVTIIRVAALMRSRRAAQFTVMVMVPLLLLMSTKVMIAINSKGTSAPPTFKAKAWLGPVGHQPAPAGHRANGGAGR